MIAIILDISSADKPGTRRCPHEGFRELEYSLVDLGEQRAIDILIVSRQVSLEATQVLSSRYVLPFDSETLDRTDYDFQGPQTYMKVSNIEMTFRADGAVYFARYDPVTETMLDEIEGYACEVSLLYCFSGTGTIRNTALVRFEPIYGSHPALSKRSDNPPLLTSQAKRHVIRKLVGFRKVSIILKFVRELHNVRYRKDSIKILNNLQGNESPEVFDILIRNARMRELDLKKEKPILERLAQRVGDGFEPFLESYTRQLIENLE